MIKNITIVSCHSREGGNLDTCFRKVNTKFVSPNSIGFTISITLPNKVIPDSAAYTFKKCNALIPSCFVPLSVLPSIA
ncbi:hypothetical protein [Candidatus Tisiphia endosymbiont of Hybos culiciformis]|uniref:hypothetical protein n=1 Tax=Candidatus Tisiphia endosymbiont of Hybos culiciformis TaxID=3139331 RepID=UPI003CCB4600